MRFRRKVGNNFVKYKMDKIKGQILALLAPSEEFIGGIEEILKSLGIKNGYFLHKLVLGLCDAERMILFSLFFLYLYIGWKLSFTGLILRIIMIQKV